MSTTTAPPSPCRHPVRALAIGLLILLVAACAPPAKRPDTVAAAAPDAEVERLLEAGDYRAAAQRLLATAAQATPPQRDELRLAAAEALLRGQLIDEAEQLLVQLPPSGSPAYVTRLTLAQAAVQSAHGDALGALRRLAAIDAQVPDAYRVDFHRARAAAYAAAGNTLESAREHVWLDGLLPPEERTANQEAIWHLLSQLPDTVLAGLRTAPPPDVLSGWMELVETLRGVREDPDRLEAALANWRVRYPGHPATTEFIERMRGLFLQPAIQPGHIAVLLPLSGALADAGAALRDGILAAYYQSLERAHVQLRFYDTGGDTGGDTGADDTQIRGIYQRAVDAGAELVLGPLTKEAVAELARADNLTIPVLALNTLAEPVRPPAQLYQFSLAPEDEARAAATRAWQDGHRRALTLYPEGAWGERVHQAFVTQWRELGGTVLDGQAYGTDQRTYSNLVRALLNIDASEQRQQTLTRLLGRQPEFEPRRRQDVDFIFMVAYPQQGRLLRPLLRFHRASRLPVYATSQIFTGVISPDLDRDMDGVRFCDMPWTLQTEHPAAGLHALLDRLWPDRARQYSRLYAMGIDAYQLTPYLQGLGSGAFARHPGVTGDLYLDPQQRLHRDLHWAQFKSGRPEPLPPTVSSVDPLEDDTLEPDGMEPLQDGMDDYPDAQTDNTPDAPTRDPRTDTGPTR